MKTTDGLKLASSAAALLVAAAAMSSATHAADVEEPVKVSQCQGIEGISDIVSFTSGHAMVSKSLCDKLGGNQIATASVPAQAPVPTGVQVAYCNDLFSCNTFSACKGNGNDNCAGQNTCHGIGFVAILSSDMSISEQLCGKLGGNLISAL
jgi:opacity protein-like surface antigen